MDHSGRIGRAREAAAAAGADVLLVSRMSNIRYLTGFTGSLGYLILDADPVLVVDFRYATQAAAEAHAVRLELVDASTSVWPTALELLARRCSAEPVRAGVEADTLTLAAYSEVAARLGAVTATRALVERLRAVKDPAELAELRRAVDLTDRMLADVLALIRPGMSEFELAGHVELLQFTHGGGGSASPIIAASGPRTALCHGLPTDRTLAAGEAVMLDVGTSSAGYGADTTRTYHLGPASSRFAELYDIVLAAQEAGLAAVRPGVTGREVDGIARRIIEDAGYGEHYRHSLGHSIGLDYHERPLLGPFDDTVLEPGMVFTVEPGIYLEGFGGVRIEDMVVVTADGCENLTHAPKELIEL